MQPHKQRNFGTKHSKQKTKHYTKTQSNLFKLKSVYRLPKGNRRSVNKTNKNGTLFASRWKNLMNETSGCAYLIDRFHSINILK